MHAEMMALRYIFMNNVKNPSMEIEYIKKVDNIMPAYMCNKCYHVINKYNIPIYTIINGYRVRINGINNGLSKGDRKD